jgi:hypothetical protein
VPVAQLFFQIKRILPSLNSAIQCSDFYYIVFIHL